MLMEAMLEEIVNEETEEMKNEGFKIDDPTKAEWALKKIGLAQAERDKYINVCKTMADEYKMKIDKANQKYENETRFLQDQLKDYFQTVDRKVTKTQETFKLPSGKLVLKYPSVTFKRDEETATKWLKDNNLNDFIKVTETIDWTNLKKIVEVSGENIVTEDGEIIEGIKAIPTEEKFEIKVDI